MSNIALTDSDLIAEVEAIIRSVAADPDAAVWHNPMAGDRLEFVSVSPGFRDMTQVERQERLWEAIRARLGQEALRIARVFTRTPDEVK